MKAHYFLLRDIDFPAMQLFKFLLSIFAERLPSVVLLIFFIGCFKINVKVSYISYIPNKINKTTNCMWVTIMN